MPPHVLVVVIDGLRASALGAYGNTSFATPALDRFAAESLLVDWCYAPSADLPDIYRALWHSSHPSVSLPRLFVDHGYATILVTDEPVLKSFTAAADFDDVVQVGANSLEVSATGERTDDPYKTSLALPFSAAMDRAVGERHGKPRLIWLHARGMYGPWDAPLEFQQYLLDEEDQPPIESSLPPDLVVTPDDDPDIAFRYASAYAAQAMVLDACWESLLDAMNATADDEWLIMLIGARGFPLGEHSRIGGVDPRLHVEQLHVPWLIRFPGNIGRLARTGMLTSHNDLPMTLLDWIDHERKLNLPTSGGMSLVPLASAARTTWRDAILSTSASARSIRTSAWCLREELSSEAPPPELYVRPDDRWEANDVAKLCPYVVEELRALVAGRISARS